MLAGSQAVCWVGVGVSLIYMDLVCMERTKQREDIQSAVRWASPGEASLGEGLCKAQGVEGAGTPWLVLGQGVACT